jgi:PAS domain S-box-containing protein
LAVRVNRRIAPSEPLGLNICSPERYRQHQRGKWGLAKLFFVLTASCLLFQSTSAAAPLKEVRRVLILHSLGFSSPASVLVDREIRAALENSPYQIELYEEPLQGILFSDPASRREVRQEFIHRYRDRKLDVVIAVGPSPIEFMVQSPKAFGPGIPVVICASTEDQLGNLKLDSRFTGAWRNVDPARTLEAALRLEPGTQHVVVVGGSVFWYDRRLVGIVKEALRSYESRLDFTYLTNLEMPALLERLKRLPEHTIIFYTAISQDAAGTRFIDETQSLPLTVGAANAPIFVMEDTFVGQGTMGGYVTPYADEGRAAGTTAVRLLSGEKPQNIPIVRETDVYMFDWRALQRWGARESALPPGSVVLYRQPTAWQAYKRYIIAAILLCVAEALLILALLSQRARRRKVEESLVERLAFESLLSDLSTTFINLPEEQVDSNIENGLGRIAEFLNIEGITLYEFSQDRTELTATFSWTREASKPAPTVVTMNRMPWWTSHVLRGEVLLVSDTNALPEEASTERACFRKADVLSAASIPLKIGGEAIGTLWFASEKRRILWTEDLVKQLIALADIFSNALTRKRAIAELKLAEADARESEKRFRLVADTAPVLIWMAGTDKLCTYFNKGWLDFTGRSMEIESGNGWAEGVHSEDLQGCIDTYSRAFDRRDEFRMEYRLRRHDGEYRWVFDIGVPRFNQDRSFIGYIGVGIDITDRILAREELLKSEERFRLAAQAGKMFAYAWDAATDELVRSAESAEILGIDEATHTTGRQTLSQVYPDDREKLLAAVAALRPEKPHLRITYRIVRPDGAVIWVERQSRAHFDEHGKMLRIIGMVADVTERKRVEEALQRSESNYRLFISQSSEGIFCQEIDRPIPVDLPEDEQVQRILHESYLAECNDALAGMYGMCPADFVGKRLTETLDAENPVNVELTRDYVRGGYRVVDRESHEVDLQGNPRVFLNSMIGIVENDMLVRTWGIQRDITDRREVEQARWRAEQALRESEQRFRLAIQAGKMYAFEWNTATDVIVRSSESANILNWSTDPGLDTGRQFAATVHPDDLEAYAATEASLTPENSTYRISFRLLRPDRVVVWLEDSGRAFFDTQGKMVRIVGMVADITDRKLAETALANVSRRLIEAQEQERTRIARDLHDDVGQRLALLANQLEQLQQDSPDVPAEIRSRMSEMYKQSCEIATSVQALSHELHSAKLEYLGIAAAMRGFCREFAQQQKLEIDFKTRDLPSPVSPDIALCLFRILQEAVHNSEKHSGVRHIDVQLWGTSDEVHLVVSDSGVGFDSKVAKQSRGLGLTSMEERIKLLKGTLAIDSQPNRGTTIHASAPIPRSDLMRAAG